MACKGDANAPKVLRSTGVSCLILFIVALKDAVDWRMNIVLPVTRQDNV
jgi:hypothetical protein